MGARGIIPTCHAVGIIIIRQNVHQTGSDECWQEIDSREGNSKLEQQPARPVPLPDHRIPFPTQLKNYFYTWITEENPFVIPKHITCKAKHKKIALVLDMDETLVYTRR